MLVTKKQMELGVVLIHIGAETTGVAVYKEGQLFYTAIFPFGSSNITRDIVYGLRTSMEIAEKVKLKYAKAHRPNQKHQHKIDLSEFGGKGIVNSYDLDRIVYARCNEMFNIIANQIAKVDAKKQLAAGVVISGGGANMDGMVDFISEQLKLPTAIGVSHKYTGVTDKITDPGYAAAIGLMLQDMDSPIIPSTNPLEGIIGNIGSKLKSIFKSLTP